MLRNFINGYDALFQGKYWKILNIIDNPKKNKKNKIKPKNF